MEQKLREKKEWKIGEEIRGEDLPVVLKMSYKTAGPVNLTSGRLLLYISYPPPETFSFQAQLTFKIVTELLLHRNVKEKKTSIHFAYILCIHMRKGGGRIEAINGVQRGKWLREEDKEQNKQQG